MNKSINPPSDFVSMQRISFCWFIEQGLSDELAAFSRIYDFSRNTEYVLFGQEYKLSKPVYTIVRAKRFMTNYSAQLVIPLEARDPKLNSIKYKTDFSVVNLPLMTRSATFILNGCERVIISQIIRSPGIYFEKNKSQKIRSQFKKHLSSDIRKLGSIIVSGDIFINECNIFFPNLVQEKNKITNLEWKKTNFNWYTFIDYKQNRKSSNLYLLQCFKIYRTISKTLKNQTKDKLVRLFLKWLFNTNSSMKFKSSDILYLFTYFNLLLKFLLRYEILINKLNSQNQVSIVAKKILREYEKIILIAQKEVQIQLNYELFTVTNKIESDLKNVTNFPFLRIIVEKQKIKNFIKLSKNKKLKPTLYFSTSLKENLKYTLKDIKAKKNNPLYQLTDKRRHKYLKTKTQSLLYKEEHPIIDRYYSNYNEKNLYTAILIPERGSWVRFGYRKNTKINPYKYPIKNQEDEIIIQIDKITQKPVLHFLKEMGLTNTEIYRNLQHSDFFYFNKPFLTNCVSSKVPVLRFISQNEFSSSISDFSRIFDSNYYRLGKVGRAKLNHRLNLKLDQRLETITYEDIFAIIDHLIIISISNQIGDDIDHLKNRRVRSVGELLQHLFYVGFQRLARKLANKINKKDSDPFSSFNVVAATIKEFFSSSQLSQYMDQTNPLSSLTHRRRISGFGPGGFDRDRISFSVRDIHPSHYGRICPIETSEGQNVGLIGSLTTCARVNKSGFLETPFWRVLNGKVIKNAEPIYLTAETEDFYKIAPADIATNSENYLMRNLISVRYRQDFVSVPPSDIDFIAISPIQVVSVATSLIPFFEHDDANRALMGSNMQRQSVPLIMPQKPIVGTGLEHHIATDSGMTINSQISGIVHSVTANEIILKDQLGKEISHKLRKYQISNQETCVNYRPIVWQGENVKSGQILTDGPGIVQGELALGQNVLVAYMPWQGYNFEDAILINERLIYDDVFTSIHIERYEIEIDCASQDGEVMTKNIPNLSQAELQHLDEDGLVTIGTFVKPGTILVGKIVAKNDWEQLPESKLLRAIFGAKAQGVKDTSFRMPQGEYGRVIQAYSFVRRTKLLYKFRTIHIFIAQIRKIQVGDKIAGRHGNKGIISRILARQDMPFLPDGTPIDIILNPLGVPSRMNVGQLYECLLGLAGHKLNRRFKILPFDEMYGAEVSRILINKKLRQASIENDEAWLFNPYAPGKMVLIDGRTGIEFDNPVTIGVAYMLKLIHLVDDKMHSRATGPYSLVTQQPLGGKAQHGGQRFGEMEVWALEGFGAAFTLKELLTIKSDDMQGRNETLTAVVKGQPIPTSGIPESFKVLLQELRSIGLDMTIHKLERFSSNRIYDTEINLIEQYDPLTKIFPSKSNIDSISF